MTKKTLAEQIEELKAEQQKEASKTAKPEVHVEQEEPKKIKKGKKGDE